MVNVSTSLKSVLLSVAPAQALNVGVRHVLPLLLSVNGNPLILGNATGAPPPPSSTYRGCLVAIFRAGKQELALGNAIAIARADQILVEFNELRIVSKAQPLLIGDKRARRFLAPANSPGPNPAR